jgi:hypothetical protein
MESNLRAAAVGALSGTTVFKNIAFVRSAILPGRVKGWSRRAGHLHRFGPARGAQLLARQHRPTVRAPRSDLPRMRSSFRGSAEPAPVKSLLVWAASYDASRHSH